MENMSFSAILRKLPALRRGTIRIRTGIASLTGTSGLMPLRARKLLFSGTGRNSFAGMGKSSLRNFYCEAGLSTHWARSPGTRAFATG